MREKLFYSITNIKACNVPTTMEERASKAIRNRSTIRVKRKDNLLNIIIGRTPNQHRVFILINNFRNMDNNYIFPQMI